MSAGDAAGVVPVESQVALVAADPLDFFPGNDLFIRGRAAVCTRFDYPHVYWRWADEETPTESSEKHRSYSCTPHIFQVAADKKCRSEDDSIAPTQGIDDSSDEEEVVERQVAEEFSAGADNSAVVPSTGAPGGADDDEVVTSTPVNTEAAARASLMSMFSRRPEKVLVSHVTDAADQAINAAAPQSVSIDNSARASFRIAHKVTSITLLNCEDVELEFLSVISSVELIRCRRCVIRCTQTCGTFTLDDAEACSVHFPGYQSRVMLVSTGSSGTTLVAVPGGNPPPSDDLELEEKAPALDEEIRFVIQENDEPEEEEEEAESAAAADSNVVVSGGPEILSSPAPTPSVPVSRPVAVATPPQFRTIWTNGQFSTERLERRGPLGYFHNNA